MPSSSSCLFLPLSSNRTYLHFPPGYGDRQATSRAWKGMRGQLDRCACEDSSIGATGNRMWLRRGCGQGWLRWVWLRRGCELLGVASSGMRTRTRTAPRAGGAARQGRQRALQGGGVGGYGAADAAMMLGHSPPRSQSQMVARGKGGAAVETGGGAVGGCAAVAVDCAR